MTSDNTALNTFFNFGPACAIVVKTFTIFSDQVGRLTLPCVVPPAILLVHFSHFTPCTLR
eukprot:TRINITY_DN2609_c1_g1_i1.p2 TRINITY_DN2609_c1_g1~~TRINITY_DN2609_c1_g1_i1.p2  ORF type:complete len:60 (+),score=7.71 TRINITY_DN2609_c1_g1_i1:270-449(+)